MKVGFRGAVSGVAAALVLAGCSGTSGDSASAGATAGAAEGYDPALASFYTQEVAWEDCSDPEMGTTAECTWVDVPLDYAEPDGGSTRLRVLRVPASEGEATRGSLLVNPGGPGGSAVDYAQLADFIVSEQVRANFDVVGVDPRGVGESNPIWCVDAPTMDGVMAMDPTPDTAEEAEAGYTSTTKTGEACKEKYPELIGHVSTYEAAQDMDIVRELLGDERLNFLGKSYGTFLGATYAGQFPQRAGNMVLDGAIAPDLTNKEVNLGQAKGFEMATQAWVASCVDSGQCPLGSDATTATKGLNDFFASLDADPLPVQGDPRVTELTEGWATIGVAQAMYTPSYWDTLTQALQAAKEGDGTPLFSLAEEYAGRSDDGTYDTNIMQVITAINCLDRGDTKASADEMAQRVDEFSQAAPVWGEMMAFSSNSCAAWPIEATGEPEPIAATGSGPLLVVGTTRDPATPYEWAERLAGQLEGGHLLTYDGDGHTAYLQGSSCVDTAVDAYLMNGEPPADGATC